MKKSEYATVKVLVIRPGVDSLGEQTVAITDFPEYKIHNELIEEALSGLDALDCLDPSKRGTRVFDDRPEMIEIKHGDLMHFDDWRRCVCSGGFVDYDGFGVWSDGKRIPVRSYDNRMIVPSQYKEGRYEKPMWATHVVWYNR